MNVKNFYIAMQRLHVITAILKCFQGRSLDKVQTNMDPKRVEKNLNTSVKGIDRSFELRGESRLI
jgi:hypothetical protein